MTLDIHTTALPFHNILRWAVLLFGLWAIIRAVIGITGKKVYTGADSKVSLFFMISCDIQLLIGLILYFSGPWFKMLINNTKEVMKDSAMRFFAMEHILMMIIAWVLVHVGRSAVKRSAIDSKKHKRSLIYFGIALLIILMMIPWSFREAGIARPLLPQF